MSLNRAAAHGAMGLIALPWLNPFTFGPMPNAVPVLLAWFCGIAIWIQLGSHLPYRAKHSLGQIAASAWLLAACLSALIGLLQYFGLTHHFGYWVSGSAPGEAFANLRQRNQFATLTNMGLLALLWWQMHLLNAERATAITEPDAQVPRETGALAKLFPMALAALLAIGNEASASRTGLLQLFVVVILALVWGAWQSSAARRVLLSALLAYALAAVVLPMLAGLELQSTGIFGRVSEAAPACASRQVLWGNVLHLIAQKPWLGWGWGELDYAHFITLYEGGADQRFCDMLDNAHNLPLHIAVELGVPMALLVCGAVIGLLVRARPWRETDATRQLAWGVLAVIGLHSLLEYPLWYGPFQVAAVVCVCLLRKSKRDTSTNANRVNTFRLGLAVAALASLSLIAWDYYRVSQIYLEPSQRASAYRQGTLEKIQNILFFKRQIEFAKLTLTPLTRANAAEQNESARALLHFSPEAVVVEKIIESAGLLDASEEALFYLVRYKTAYPVQYEAWRKRAI